MYRSLNLMIIAAALVACPSVRSIDPTFICHRDGDCGPGMYCDPTGTCVFQHPPDAGEEDAGEVEDSGRPDLGHDAGPGDAGSDGCSPATHDGGDGVCVPLGICSEGYHDGGVGQCVATDSCSSGYHDGGDGTCRQLGSCSTGFHDDGSGTCVSQSSCGSGSHDGGDGRCVPNDTCVSGYLLDTRGACVSATNCSLAPAVARAGVDQTVAVGTPVTLNAASSSGVAPLQYQWSLQKPSGSNTTLSASASPSVTFTPDGPADFAVTLNVVDARSCTASWTVTVHSTGARPSIKVNVTWDPSHGEVWLHYLAPGGSFFEPSRDCNYRYQTPDFGPGGPDGSDTNDPELTLYSPWGGRGGTTVVHTHPFDGTYSVIVNYYCSRPYEDITMPTGMVTATVHVFSNNNEIYTASHRLTQRDNWTAAQIVVSNGAAFVNAVAGPQTITSVYGCTMDNF